MSVTIKVAHLKITDHLILGVTKDNLDKGKESFQHLQLETVSKMGWNQVVEALQNDEVNAACILAPLAIDLYHSGMEIKLILLGHKTGSILVKNKAANIQKMEDFKGKMIAIPYQLSVHHMLLHQLCVKHGLSVGAGKDVALEVMAPSQMPDAIQYDDQGEVGGFIVAEPFGSKAIKEGYGEEMYLSKDLWPKHPCCVLVVKDDLIQNHSDAVQELTNSLVKAGKFVCDQTSEAVPIAASFLEQKEEVIHHVLTEPKDRVLISDELLPIIADLAKLQDYMCDKMGIIKEKINLEEFVDLTFAKAAGAV